MTLEELIVLGRQWEEMPPIAPGEMTLVSVVLAKRLLRLRELLVENLEGELIGTQTCAEGCLEFILEKDEAREALELLKGEV